MSDEENTMSEQTPEPESTETVETETAETEEATDTQVLAEEPVEEPVADLAEESSVRRGFAAGLHPVNVLHLVLGVAFLGMVVNWALIESGAVETSGLRWLLPIPWVAAGAAGLIATAPRLRGRSG